jgi:hypothetical protein
MFRGVNFLKIETVAELSDSVNTSATHMTIVLATRFVTASVLHIPSTCLNTGLFRQSPSEIIFLVSDFIFLLR